MTNDAEMRLEDAVMDLLECKTERLDDCKTDLEFVLALNDVDRAALVARADREADRLRHQLARDHSNVTYRQFIRWRLIAESAARAARYDPSLRPQPKKEIKWRTK
jgi:hypothetical protein